VAPGQTATAALRPLGVLGASGHILLSARLLQTHDNSLPSEEALGICTSVTGDRAWVPRLLGLPVSQAETQLPPGPSTLAVFVLVE